MAPLIIKSSVFMAGLLTFLIGLGVGGWWLVVGKKYAVDLV